MKQILGILVIFIAIAGTSHAELKQLRIGVSIGYPPFYFLSENNQPTGICIDVINQVADSMNISVQYESFPWKRMLDYGKEGKVDAVMPLFKTGEREEFLIFPEVELITEDNSFFTAKSNPMVYSGALVDVVDRKIAVLDTYSYGAEFDNLDFANKTIAKTAEQLIALVQNQRVELGIGNSKVITYTAKQAAAADDIRFLFPPVTVSPLYIGFSKKKIDQDFVKRFNAYLERFKQTTKYTEIIRTYGL